MIAEEIDEFYNVSDAVEPCKVRGVFFCHFAHAATSACEASQVTISLSFQRVQFGESLTARGKLGRSRCQRHTVLRVMW